MSTRDLGSMNYFPVIRFGRVRISVLILLLLMVLIGSSWVQAQTSSNKLTIGEAVTGTIDAANFKQTYVYVGKAGDLITITVTSKTQTLSLAVLVTNSDGITVGQGINPSTISNLKLDTDEVWSGRAYSRRSNRTGGRFHDSRCAADIRAKPI